jgi:hypothetical protein
MKPVIRVQELPDQVLLEVFRHATWVPYSIEFSDLVLKSLQSSQAKQIAREYRLSLVSAGSPFLWACNEPSIR